MINFIIITYSFKLFVLNVLIAYIDRYFRYTMYAYIRTCINFNSDEIWYMYIQVF